MEDEDHDEDSQDDEGEEDKEDKEDNVDDEDNEADKTDDDVEDGKEKLGKKIVKERKNRSLNVHHLRAPHTVTVLKNGVGCLLSTQSL